jgi:hypothetical protein
MCHAGDDVFVVMEEGVAREGTTLEGGVGKSDMSGK